VLGIYRNTTGQGAEWQLYSVEVATGAETLLAGVDLPITTASIGGFSLESLFSAASTSPLNTNCMCTASVTWRCSVKVIFVAGAVGGGGGACA
jgi:hypothetical protein